MCLLLESASHNFSLARLVRILCCLLFFSFIFFSYVSVLINLLRLLSWILNPCQPGLAGSACCYLPVVISLELVCAAFTQNAFPGAARTHGQRTRDADTDGH